MIKRIKVIFQGFLCFSAGGRAGTGRGGSWQRRCRSLQPGRLRVWVFESDKCDITGVFEDDDDAGCTRCRCAMARIGSDREARSETREGACSPRASIDSGLLGEVFWGGARVFQREKIVIMGFYEGFRFKVSGFRVSESVAGCWDAGSGRGLVIMGWF